MKRYRPATPAVVVPGRKPQGWSLELEILATLPLAAPTPLETLASDFRLTVNETRRVVHRLCRDFGVIHMPADGEADEVEKVRVPARHRELVADTTEQYWSRVWEHKPAYSLN